MEDGWPLPGGARSPEARKTAAGGSAVDGAVAAAVPWARGGNDEVQREMAEAMEVAVMSFTFGHDRKERLELHGSGEFSRRARSARSDAEKNSTRCIV